MTDIILLQTKFGIWDIMGARVPTGLLSIAAVPYKEKYSIVLIDQRMNPDWQSDVKKNIKKGAKVVCLTAMVGEQIKHMTMASSFVKSIKKDIIVFLGGSWAQTEPLNCFDDKNVDIVCFGEGDYALKEIMDYVFGKKRITEIKGIAYRGKDGKIIKNKPRPLTENLNKLPKIPYELINLNDYTAINFRPNAKSISLVTSRGCGFGCTFCSINALYGRKWRGYSVKRMLEDLKVFETRHKIRDFYFNDDNMAADYGRFIELINALASLNKNYFWGTAGIRADTILKMSENDLETLVKSGCKNIDIGIESGCERILKMIKKGETLKTFENVNRKLSRYPLIIKYTFMLGFPTETKEEIIQTLKFRKKLLDENKFATAPIFMYTPFPNTPLFDLALSSGLKPPKDLIGWSDFNYNTWYKKYPSWMRGRMRKYIENIIFLSYFEDKKLGYKFPNPLFKELFRLYHPIAKFRSKHNFYLFMVEKWTADMVGILNEKTNFFNKSQKSRKYV